MHLAREKPDGLERQATALTLEAATYDCLPTLGAVPGFSSRGCHAIV
jgi:hypothetical protein